MYIGKVIKKILFIVFILIFGFIAVFQLFIVALNLPYINGVVSERISVRTSELIGFRVEIEGITFLPFSEIRIRGFSASDENGKEIVGFLSGEASIDWSGFLLNELHLKELRLDSLFCHADMKEGCFSSNKLDSLQGNRSNLGVRIERLDVEGSGCDVRLKSGKRLDFSDVGIHINDINAGEEMLSFEIDGISFMEKNMRRRGELSLEMKMRDDTVTMRKMVGRYGGTSIRIDTAGIDFRDDEIESFMVNVEKLHLSGEGFSLMSGKRYEGSDFNFCGRFFGDKDRVVGEEIYIENGGDTRAEIRGEVMNYMDIEHSNLDIEISNARTSDRDILAIFGIDLEREVGEISFGMRAKGPADDIKIEVSAGSEIGRLSADFYAKIGEEMTLDGRIESDGIDMRDLTDGRVGHADFSADIYARYRGNDMSFIDISGMGRELEIYGYMYKNVNAKYRMEKGVGYGALEVDDENAHVIFGGGYDVSGDTGRYYGLAIIDTLNLDRTKILMDHKNSSISGRVRMRMEGKEIDDMNGYLSAEHFRLRDGEKHAEIDSVYLKVVSDGDQKSIDLRSDFLNGGIHGNFRYEDILHEVRYQLTRASDAIFPEESYEVPAETYGELLLEYDHVEKLTQFLSDELEFANDGKIYAHINGDDHTAGMTLTVGDVIYGENKIDDLEVEIVSDENGISLGLNLDLLTLFSVGEFGRISLYNTLSKNKLHSFASWYDDNYDDFSGTISLHTDFKRDFEGLSSRISFDENEMYFRGTNWSILPSSIEKRGDSWSFENLRLIGDERLFSVDGRISEEEGDTLRIELRHLELENLIHEGKDSKFAIGGDMTMSLEMSKAGGNLVVKNKTLVENLYVNHDYLDHLEIDAEWDEGGERSPIEVRLYDGERLCAKAEGGYSHEENYFDLLFDIDRTSVGFLNYYLSDAVKDISGTASGKLRIYGEVPDLKMEASLGVNRTTFMIKQTLVDYEFIGGDTIYISPDEIRFGDLAFKDRNGNVGRFYGKISHDMFSGLGLDVYFRMNDQLLYDKTVFESPTYYGTIYGSGLLHIMGTTSNVELRIDGKTSEQYGSTFYILPLERSDFSGNSFVHFVNNEGGVMIDMEELMSSVTATMDVEISDNSTINVVLNSQTRNQMTVSGRGKMTLDVNRSGDLTIQGNYEIESGTYNFSFENIINKRFEINRGSMIRWDGGDPYDALLDISATYKLKASLYDLVSGSSGAYNTSDLKRRVPVNCNLLLSGRMSDPGINFKIEIPSTTNSSQYIFDQYVSTDEEMNRQAFSLLLANRFYTVEDGSNGMGSTSSYLGTTASELISNQISSRLSQNKYNVGIGLNYRPGDEVQNEEYEVSFTTQLFDNNVLLSGNVGYGRDVTDETNGNFIGDFDVEVKLNKRGNLRAKAYTHSNNDVVYETSPTTQGIGVAYGDNFNSFSELWGKYWYVLSGKRRKDRKNIE